MKFEVINSLGKIVENTQYKECIPKKAQIKAIQKAGYKIKINGKVVKNKALDEFLISIGRDK